jgi:hypothetical protein
VNREDPNRNCYGFFPTEENAQDVWNRFSNRYSDCRDEITDETIENVNVSNQFALENAVDSKRFDEDSQIDVDKEQVVDRTVRVLFSYQHISTTHQYTNVSTKHKH